jgi:hypothetical protein
VDFLDNFAGVCFVFRHPPPPPPRPLKEVPDI